METEKEMLPSANKIEIKKEILLNYQLKIAEFYYIFNGNVKKLLPTFFNKKGMCFIMKSYSFIEG